MAKLFYATLATLACLLIVGHGAFSQTTTTTFSPEELKSLGDQQQVIGDTDKTDNSEPWDKAVPQPNQGSGQGSSWDTSNDQQPQKQQQQRPSGGPMQQRFPPPPPHHGGGGHGPRPPMPPHHGPGGPGGPGGAGPRPPMPPHLGGRGGPRPSPPQQGGPGPKRPHPPPKPKSDGPNKLNGKDQQEQKQQDGQQSADNQTDAQNGDNENVAPQEQIDLSPTNNGTEEQPEELSKVSTSTLSSLPEEN